MSHPVLVTVVAGATSFALLPIVVGEGWRLVRYGLTEVWPYRLLTVLTCSLVIGGSAWEVARWSGEAWGLWKLADFSWNESVTLGLRVVILVVALFALALYRRARA